MNWHTVDNIKDFEEFEKNNPSGFLIFKHSTRCSTSSMAKRMFENHWSEPIPAILVYVVESRQLSNAIESRYRIRHESPQVLLIQNGNCTYNSSHSAIDADDIHKMVIS